MRWFYFVASQFICINYQVYHYFRAFYHYVLEGVMWYFEEGTMLSLSQKLLDDLSFFLHHLFGKILPYLFLFVTTTFGMFWVCCELRLYFSGAPGHFPDPAKCRLLSVNEKRELVRELSKFPGNAPEQLQEWTRREIVEILCVELGRERKYTGLSKQRMLDHLFRVVNGKSSDHRKHLESNPESNASNLQSPSKRQRKDDSSSPLPVIGSTPRTAGVSAPTSNAHLCQNSACSATLNPEDKFCRRCSCCICFKYDENKDPSLWLFCNSDQPLQEDSCGLSCHLECALKDERSGILQSGQSKKLDGDYYCIHCGKQNNLLG